MKKDRGGLGSSSGLARPGKKKKKAALSSRLLFSLCILIIINITGSGGPPGIFPVSRRPSPPLKKDLTHFANQFYFYNIFTFSYIIYIRKLKTGYAT